VSGVLLDTYVVNDLINDQARLTGPVRQAIAAATGRIYASAASAMELAFHVRDGRTSFAVSVPDLARGLEEAGVTVLPVSWHEFASAVTVPVPHRDPFDRILVATALARDLTFLTADENIQRCPALRCIG
jgi:PIN domain nuclease of toxin-antitoxin system